MSAVIQGQGNVHLYIDGIEDVGGGYSGTGGAMVYTTAMSKIGAGGNVYFNGAIDDVRVYNRALSSTEIHLLANPPVGYWPLDANALDFSGTPPKAQ